MVAATPRELYQAILSLICHLQQAARIYCQHFWPSQFIQPLLHLHFATFYKPTVKNATQLIYIQNALLYYTLYIIKYYTLRQQRHKARNPNDNEL